MRLRSCPVCTTVFRVSEFNYKHNYKMYCSRSCKEMHTHVYVDCGYCKRYFWVYRSRIGLNGNYCSRRCMAGGFADKAFAKKHSVYE